MFSVLAWGTPLIHSMQYRIALDSGSLAINLRPKYTNIIVVYANHILLIL